MAFVEGTGTPSYDIYPPGYVRDISSWIDRQQWEQTGGYGAYYQNISTSGEDAVSTFSGVLVLGILLVLALVLGG